jgi:hypothetical protein
MTQNPPDRLAFRLVEFRECFTTEHEAFDFSPVQPSKDQKLKLLNSHAVDLLHLGSVMLDER